MFRLFRKKEKDNIGLFFKTDIHSHLVPAIDDGSRSAERSVELVSRMKGWGINRVITTPHVTEDTFENTPEIIKIAFGELTKKLTDNAMTIDIDYSAEYRIDNFCTEQMDKGLLRPLPGNYLLVENSFIQEPFGLDNTLYQIKLKGFRPILAHPERYGYYGEKRCRYSQLHDAGTLFQVNILSLAGYYGKEEKRTAEWLIDNNLVDFVATDLHRSAHADAIDEYLSSRDYRRHSEALAERVLNDKVFPHGNRD